MSLADKLGIVFFLILFNTLLILVVQHNGYDTGYNDGLKRGRVFSFQDQWNDGYQKGYAAAQLDALEMDPNAPTP